jgi:hypothetical protein
LALIDVLLSCFIIDFIGHDIYNLKSISPKHAGLMVKINLSMFGSVYEVFMLIKVGIVEIYSKDSSSNFSRFCNIVANLSINRREMKPAIFFSYVFPVALYRRTS